MLTADKILVMKKPGELFNRDDIKREYKDYARYWHPDLPTGNNAVMSHINDLYQLGLQQIAAGKWEGFNFLVIGGRELGFLTTVKFELGMMYIGHSYVAYFVEKKYNNLFDNALVNLTFKYASDKMREEFLKFLPTKLDIFETDEHIVLVVRKTRDLLLLKDVLEYSKGELPDRHVAWILSSLYNLACYINFSQLSHNAINLNTYFISPSLHGGALLGGWWYTVPINSKMLGVPAENFAITPPKIRDKKVGSINSDLEAIRAIGRNLLGNQDAPEALQRWLKGASAETAYKEYGLWNKVLDDSYGKRSFVELHITAEMLYF